MTSTHRRVRKGTVLLTAILSALAVLAGPAPASAATGSLPPVSDAVPVTVPTVQQWEPGGRDYRLPQGVVRVVVAGSDADALLADAPTFAQDLRAETGRPVTVISPADSAVSLPGDIRLRRTAQASPHGTEAHTIVVADTLTVEADTVDGVWSGTRSVLQLLGQGDSIPGGTITDWPDYPERSFMVDNGRKYFTPEWARRQIRELSRLKYNQFHWHISDNAGFRIESRTHPEVVSPEHWTQEQVRDLVAYAERYHVEVIPEIDMPGHMQFALREHPDLQVVKADGTRNANNLDVTKPEARTFVRDILDELVPLFAGRYVHTGGDEFTSDWAAYPVLRDWAQATYGPTANAQDAVLDFTNDINQVVRAHGKTMRIWNDGAQGGVAVEADRDIVLEYWSSQHGGVLAQEFLDRGYKIVNANRNVLYDVPAATPTWNNLDPRKVYEQWDMTKWHDFIGPNTTAPQAPGVLGGQIHIWNDSPLAATEEQEAGRLAMPLRAMIEQLWGSDLRPAGWDELAARAFAAGRDPGWYADASATGNLARDRLTWSTSRERPDCHEAALVDGDPATRWCGPKTAPQTAVIDLGQSRDLGTIVLRWQTAYAKAYRLEVSDDLAAWRGVVNESVSDGGVDLHRVEARGRYLRLAMTERGTQFGYSLWEIEAYATGDPVPADFSATATPRVVLAEPGTPGTATVTVTNGSPEPVTVQWTADGPEGVRLVPASGTLRVPAGGSADTTVHASSERVGSYPARLTVTGRTSAGEVPLAATDLLVTVPYADLADAFTNVGVTSDDDIAPPGLGTGFDGAGSSYSEQALATAGLRPGEPVTVGGVTLEWPDAAAGTPNNVVSYGQTVQLAGHGSTIGVLTAATYGPAAGDWVVHYTDGSSQVVRMSTADWTSAPPAGTVHAADTTYRNNTETGRTARRSQLFLQRIPVDPGKELAALTLPVVSPTAVRGAPALHVFAVAVS